MVSKIKSVILILLAASLAAGLCSCAVWEDVDVTAVPDSSLPAESTVDTGENGYVPVPDGAEEAKRYADSLVASLPDREFAKETFTVAASPGIDLVPSDPADGYDDALIERNKTVESKYGVTVRQLETPLDLMLSDAYSSYLSGVFYADALMIPQRAVGEFVSKGFLLNTQSLPHADFSKEYYDADAMSQSSAGYTSPVIAGAATKDIGSYHCLYANTALLGKDVAEKLMKSVEEGSFTWDLLLETARAAADLDGGVRIIGAVNEKVLVNTVYISSEQHYLDAGAGRRPAIAFETDASLKVIETLRSLYDGGVIFDSYTEGGSELDSFTGGNILFHADTVGSMPAISRMGGDWTALPIPKTYPDGSDYYAYCSPDAPVMVIPAGNPDTDDAVCAVEALNAASFGYLERCYYQRLIRTAVNNSRTLDMVDFISGVKGGKGVYEFTEMYASTFPDLALNTTETIWELATKGGDLATAAYNSRYDMNWRFANVFPTS